MKVTVLLENLLSNLSTTERGRSVQECLEVNTHITTGFLVSLFNYPEIEIFLVNNNYEFLWFKEGKSRYTYCSNSAQLNFLKLMYRGNIASITEIN